MAACFKETNKSSGFNSQRGFKKNLSEPSSTAQTGGGQNKSSDLKALHGDHVLSVAHIIRMLFFIGRFWPLPHQQFSQIEKINNREVSLLMCHHKNSPRWQFDVFVTIITLYGLHERALQATPENTMNVKCCFYCWAAASALLHLVVRSVSLPTWDCFVPVKLLSIAAIFRSTSTWGLCCQIRFQSRIYN